MKFDIFIQTTGLILQLILVIFAWLALSAWKKEVRGKDKYQFAKDLISYVKDIAFQIYTNNGSWHQIFLNDILVNRKKFYTEQIFRIKEEKVYFDETILGLFHHIEIRSDIFLPEKVRLALEALYPLSAKMITTNKTEHTYVHLKGVKVPRIFDLNGKKDPTGIYELHSAKGITVEEYFKKWEELIIELNKLA